MNATISDYFRWKKVDFAGGAEWRLWHGQSQSTSDCTTRTVSRGDEEKSHDVAHSLI
jgi:hypothetical protein